MLISKHDFIRHQNFHHHKCESANGPTSLFVTRSSLACFAQVDGTVITLVCKGDTNSGTKLSHSPCGVECNSSRRCEGAVSYSAADHWNSRACTMCLKACEGNGAQSGVIHGICVWSKPFILKKSKTIRKIGHYLWTQVFYFFGPVSKY